MNIDGPWRNAAHGAGLLGSDGTPAATIFAEMSALAVRTGAINLGQGFPDEDGPVEVLDAARRAISDGENQYGAGMGHPLLRSAIADHQRRFYAQALDPDREILVTAGATEALAATLLALVERGDEVVTFEPFYDAYGALIALAGAKHVTVPLRAPDFAPDLDELARAVNDRTKVILVNDPHNPTGATLGDAAKRRIIELAERHNAYIVTDEVYEHLRFETPHVPIATLPGAVERTISISSGGKTFSTTGWKIGWAMARPELIQAILAVKQFLTFVSGTPFQPAIAAGLALPDSFFAGVADTLRAKRDLLSTGLRGAGFHVFESRATYFVVTDVSPLGFTDAVEFCRDLPQRAGVVAIPLSAFYTAEHRGDAASLVRFAFCKKFDVLDDAVARLGALVAA
ncbi:aminotransferase class I/II-fold pyridoxal phosphate-dependent enzyme [Gryllotalpicola reticulitermitis]|uniref:Aminotransferase class I/II-fold pyridoxal phosphate-dependent enzyme n=1 Tax=Gryllotalpicola reticulitermitis TaxID=1184153 RepID=A0ABV8QCL6_9MICO